MLEHKRVWNLYFAGQMPFEEFQEQTGVPDSFALIDVSMGPITKRRHDYIHGIAERLAKDPDRRRC